MVAIVRTYQGYAVTGTERPNPAAVYADPSSTLSLLKNAMNIVVAIISDAIIVSCLSCLAYDSDRYSLCAGVPGIHCVEHELLRRSCTARAVDGGHRCVFYCSGVRTCRLRARFVGTAVGIWAVWTLAQTGPGTIPILAAVSVRIRYFFIITFILNILCSSKCLVGHSSSPTSG